MMAGLGHRKRFLVALANDILRAGPRGLGFFGSSRGHAARLSEELIPVSFHRRAPIGPCCCGCPGLRRGTWRLPFVAFLVGAGDDFNSGLDSAARLVSRGTASFNDHRAKNFRGERKSAMAILTELVQLF